MENEAAQMAESILAKSGIVAERITVELTDEGREVLKSMASGIACETTKLPALRYEDDNKIEHILVSPFLKELSEIKDLVRYKQGTGVCETRPLSACFNVQFGVVPAGDGQNQGVMDASSALGGGTDSNEVSWHDGIRCHISLPQLSTDAIDLGYYVQPTMNGNELSVILDGPMGRRIGKSRLDLSKYRIIKVRIDISTPSKSYEIYRLLPEGEDISSRFHTFAINVPDLSENVATKIEAARNLLYRATWLKIQKKKFSMEAAMAKYYCSEVAKEVADTAVQIHGGYGLMKDYDIERFYRDQRLLQIGEGTSEIQKLVIGRLLSE